ncbi:MAG: hypothetical protein DMG26_20880 [Acidobacteria bacterium]|nr:MAG: hypothetical protein DMG26_20880 [Acidobacteriota bacterium]
MDGGVGPIIVNIAARVRNQFHALESQAADNVDGFFRMRTGSKATEIPAYRTDFGPPRDPLS